MEPSPAALTIHRPVDVDEGRRLHAAGDFAAAEAVYLAVLATRPDDPTALHLLGVLRHQQGRSDEAVELIEKALARAPDMASAWQNLVLPLVRLGRTSRALAASDEAVRRSPEAAGAWINRALACLSAGDAESAAAAAETALSIDPTSPLAWQHFGSARLREGRHALAERHFRRALALAPGARDAAIGLGEVLMETDRFDEASAVWRGLAERDGGDALARVNLGAALRSAGDMDGALAAWTGGQRSAELDYNLGCLDLLMGRWANGWSGYERRWEVPIERPPRKVAGLRLWTGGAIGTLLVHHEQGLGDTIQFAAYVPRLLAFADRILLVVQRPLKSLVEAMEPIRAVGGRILVIADGEGMLNADGWLPLLSVPHRLGLLPETVAAAPAIVPDRERVKHWKAVLDGRFGLEDDGAIRIGLVWQGNPKAPVERGRSVALAALAPIAAVPGVVFVSLQKGAGREQVASAPFPVLDLGDAFDAGPDAFLDTAAVAACLDLVVSVDTSVAHVVAAVGRPVHLMLRSVPDWRWGMEGSATPWYPSVRLFRQSSRGDWTSVVEQVAAALADHARIRRAEITAAGNAFERAVEAHRAGRPGDAIPVYRRRVAEAPADARAMNLLALALLETSAGDHVVAEEAAGLARRSVEGGAGDPDIINNAAVILKSVGAIDEAEALLRGVLARDVPHAASLQNLVNILVKRGQSAEAVRAATAVARLAPRDAGVLKSLAAALRAAKNLTEAATVLRLALTLTPDDASSRNTLGSVLAEAGDDRAARSVFEEVLERHPDDVDGWSNLGVVEKRLDGPERAVWFYRRAIARDPRHVDSRANLGSALVEMGRWDLAESVFREALALRPTHPEARMALGMTLLASGRFEDGFREYEGRIRSERLGLVSAMPPRIPRWTGQEIAGRTILVLGEQGFGDVIQFVRYAAQLKSMGAGRVIVGCRRRLAALLATVEGVDEVVAEGDSLPSADYYVFVMSLPHLTGTTLQTVPAAVPYVTPDPERVTAWAEKLAKRPGFRVGVVWQGNPDPGVDRGRSLPLADLEPLAAVPGVRLIALQKGPGSEQVDALAGKFAIETLGPEFDEGPWAFLDTAAVMANLDLVVSTDTAALHLAGALGRPTFALLKRHAEWRWMRDREDSPWYPSIRLFRQSEAEADQRAPFAGAVRRLADALAAVVRGDRLTLRPRPVEALAPLAPRPVEARFEEALSQHKVGGVERARELYFGILADEPEHLEAIHMVGAAALQAQTWPRALILLREANRLGLVTPELRMNLAIALRRTGRVAEAEAILRAVVAEGPRPEAHATLGGILADAGRLSDALTEYQNAVRLDPGLAQARRGLGNTLRDAGRPQAALAELDRAITLAPQDPETRIDRAHARLALGDYHGGFSDYEWRFKGAEMVERVFTVPRWDGSPYTGTLLVHGEQGLGDNIQFVRFVKAALARGRRVVLEVRRPLVGLFTRLHQDVTVIAEGDARPDFDLEIPMMSLPHALGLDLSGIGMDGPYLSAEPDRVARWRDWLGPFEGRTVALVHQGNPKARADKGRSPPLAALAPILEIEGVRFVSLQKEHGLDQFDGPLGAKILRPPAEFDEGPDGFLDSAALLSVADLAIVSDTALAHLSGALGRPTFLMLKHAPDWRWMFGRSDSPWYPSFRLFRQGTAGDWRSVAMMVSAALRDRARRS